MMLSRVGMSGEGSAAIMRPTTLIGSPNAGYTGSSSADGLREIPSWCSYWPFAQACQPYTEAELESLSRSQSTYVANSPNSTIPIEDRPAWIDAQVDEANRIAEAARQSDPNAEQWSISKILTVGAVGLAVLLILAKR